MLRKGKIAFVLMTANVVFFNTYLSGIGFFQLLRYFINLILKTVRLGWSFLNDE